MRPVDDPFAPGIINFSLSRMVNIWNEGMSEPEPRCGRVYDAEGARKAILNAAEAVFAEYGFDGMRIEVIAKAFSYNSSLRFHYFGDKLGLYAEVVKQADREMSELQVCELMYLPMLFIYAVGNPELIKNLLRSCCYGTD
jgi:AcrR family transcriptional regulator